jgi:hypothetical protein
VTLLSLRETIQTRCELFCRVLGCVCHLLSRQFLARIILRLWRWRRLVPPKRRLTFNGLHGVISRKKDLFVSYFIFVANKIRGVPWWWYSELSSQSNREANLRVGRTWRKERPNSSARVRSHKKSSLYIRGICVLLYWEQLREVIKSRTKTRCYMKMSSLRGLQRWTTPNAQNHIQSVTEGWTNRSIGTYVSSQDFYLTVNRQIHAYLGWSYHVRISLLSGVFVTKSCKNELISPVLSVLCPH